MGKDSNIEWTHHTANTFWGCTKVHEGCDNCLHPDTLILKSDFNWVKLKTIVVGDSLISFNEKGKSLRRYELAIVKKVWSSKNKAIEITTNETKIICSYNHKFLSSKSRNGWLRADSLNLNTALRYLPLINNFTESDSYMKGYISGSTLGDGTMSFEKEWLNKPHRETDQRYWRIAVKYNQGEFLERVSK